MFELDKGALYLYLGLLGISSPLCARVLLVGILDGPAAALAGTGVTGLVRPALLRKKLNYMPQFLASMAHSVFWKLLLIS